MRKFTGKKMIIFAATTVTIITVLSGCAPATPVSSVTPGATAPKPTATIGATAPATSVTTVPGNTSIPPQATPTSTTLIYSVDIATKTGIGNYLVDASGMTLYYFTKDSPGKSTATGTVLDNWPLFYAAKLVLPAPLKDSDFSTITRDDGLLVTAYKGRALYYFINDKTPGDTLGQGVGGVWFVVSPDNFPPQTASPTASPNLSPMPALSPTPNSPSGQPSGSGY